MFVRIRFVRALFIAVSTVALIGSSSSSDVRAEGSIVRKGDRVAIIGDSITEQKMYSKYVEAYLLACSGIPDVNVFQFGWSGETAGGFANRVENDLDSFHPTIATLCYGMNDGGYRPYEDGIGSAYENNMRNVLKKLAAIGTKSIVVGSPGAVDTDFFRPGQKMGTMPAFAAYNDNLAHLRDIDRKLATENHQYFADVHAAMFDAMSKAKASLGKEYDVCGKDGFHPGPNGQLIMAYAFLKGLGLDGQVAEIRVDANGGPSVSDGHKIVAKDGRRFTIESSRWPFCFQGDSKTSNGTRSITPYLPFNSELNRFTLKVTGLDKGAKVTWGTQSKSFTKEQLTAGINLAAEFEATPFDGNFNKLLDSIAAKQNFETFMIKSIVTQFRFLPEDLRSDEEMRDATKKMKDRLIARQRKFDADVRATLVPVQHTIEITPEG